MIDLHCHILPDVDDGPPHYAASIEMAKKAVQCGITDVFATPHHLNGRYENSKAHILERALEFNHYLEREDIPLNIHPGQELRIHRQLFTLLEMDEVLTLGNKGKYLLLELPSGEVPTYTQRVIYELLLKEITPIIVHPERNSEFIEDHDRLFELVQEGALTQLTAGSIIGHFGKRIKFFSKKIIEHNLAHFIASDAHNIGSRGSYLQEAYETITKTYGIDRTFYFRQNAELVLCGQNLQIEQPVPIRKRILGLF